MGAKLEAARKALFDLEQRRLRLDAKLASHGRGRNTLVRFEAFHHRLFGRHRPRTAAVVGSMHTSGVGAIVEFERLADGSRGDRVVNASDPMGMFA